VYVVAFRLCSLEGATGITHLQSEQNGGIQEELLPTLRHLSKSGWEQKLGPTPRRKLGTTPKSSSRTAKHDIVRSTQTSCCLGDTFPCADRKQLADRSLFILQTEFVK
jgi:hypothetical protein